MIKRLHYNYHFHLNGGIRSETGFLVCSILTSFARLTPPPKGKSIENIRKKHLSDLYTHEFTNNLGLPNVHILMPDEWNHSWNLHFIRKIKAIQETIKLRNKLDSTNTCQARTYMQHVIREGNKILLIGFRPKTQIFFGFYALEPTNNIENSNSGWTTQVNKAIVHAIGLV